MVFVSPWFSMRSKFSTGVTAIGQRWRGVAFGGAVQAVTAEAVAYAGGLRRYRAMVNNDNGAVLIWEMAQDNPSSGDAA